MLIGVRMAPGAMLGAEDGDLVEAEQAGPRSHLGLPRARITTRLGDPSGPRAVSLIAIHQHGIPDVFPDAVIDEADRMKPAGLKGREDLRHLLKQKRNFAPHLLTASERRMLARKSLPTQVWMATGKPLYNFITRRVMHWSDSEGTDDRMAGDGAAAAQALRAHPAVGEVAVFTYPRPSKGTGLYAFIETELPQDRLRQLVPAGQVELIQPVKALPRGDDGAVRQDVLHLVATNRIDELEQVLRADPALARMIASIVAGRLNITDRL